MEVLHLLQIKLFHAKDQVDEAPVWIFYRTIKNVCTHVGTYLVLHTSPAHGMQLTVGTFGIGHDMTAYT